MALFQDYRGLNTIMQRLVEPLPHVDQLVDETRGVCFFTKPMCSSKSARRNSTRHRSAFLLTS